MAAALSGQKIACFLVEQQDKEGRINSSFSKEEMADYLNVARPLLSRELGKMQQEGIDSAETKTDTDQRSEKVGRIFVIL
ncbi:MAG: helix-turn-helix domain-containing protein [Lachnospiraceae bacterium]